MILLPKRGYNYFAAFGGGFTWDLFIKMGIRQKINLN
jgi:hypothetical protein